MPLLCRSLLVLPGLLLWQSRMQMMRSNDERATRHSLLLAQHSCASPMQVGIEHC